LLGKTGTLVGKWTRECLCLLYCPRILLTLPVLLGKTTGSDDGFCPFKKGMYEITQEGDSITIKWCFNPSDNDKNNWQSNIFDLSSLKKN
jgi:hypothetical protein